MSDGFEICGVWFSHEYVTRFLSRCIPDPNSECIIWTGSKDRKGYGQVRGPITKSGSCKAHRIAYWIVRGPMFEEDTSEHICRNTSCVNPYHLAEMDRSTNTALGNIDRGDELDISDEELDFILELEDF